MAPTALPPPPSTCRHQLPPLADGGVAELTKAVVNWVTSELAGRLREGGTSLVASPVAPARLGELVALVAGGRLSGKAGKEVLTAMLGGDVRPPQDIMRARGLEQSSDAGAIRELCAAVLADPAHAATLAKYRYVWLSAFGDARPCHPNHTSLHPHLMVQGRV